MITRINIFYLFNLTIKSVGGTFAAFYFVDALGFTCPAFGRLPPLNWSDWLAK